MVVLLEGFSISTEELWSSVISFLVTSQTKALLPDCSRESLGGFKLLPFRNDGGHRVLGDLQCCRNVLVPFPRTVPLHNCHAGLGG